MSIRLSEWPLSISAALKELDRTPAGGVAIFLGRVRPDRTPSGPVTALFYEADRALALRSLQRLVDETTRRFRARAVVAWHRVGTVRVGEVAVIVGVAADHRGESFAGARYLIDRLKAETPLWKTDRIRRARPRRRRPSPRGGRAAD
jgi:molybdopterin synthase catalytic subunit